MHHNPTHVCSQSGDVHVLKILQATSEFRHTNRTQHALKVSVFKVKLDIIQKSNAS